MYWPFSYFSIYLPSDLIYTRYRIQIFQKLFLKKSLYLFFLIFAHCFHTYKCLHHADSPTPYLFLLPPRDFSWSQIPMWSEPPSPEAGYSPTAVILSQGFLSTKGLGGSAVNKANTNLPALEIPSPSWSITFPPLPGFSITIILLVGYCLGVFLFSAATQMWYILQGPALPRSSSSEATHVTIPSACRSLGFYVLISTRNSFVTVLHWYH